MILAIDAGNTRMKWGLWRTGLGALTEWHATGAIDNDAIASAAGVFARLPPPERAIVANVGAALEAHELEAVLGGVPIEWLRAGASRAGVTNGYDAPETLGVDRWAALIGARARHADAVVVVNCGTATTIDRIDATGRFEGGMILPGLGLMKRALAHHTAGLPLAQGSYRDAPTNTADAIESGCIAAELGAIRHMLAAVPGAHCLLTGGASGRLSPLLGVRHEMVEHLTLEGLVRMTQ